MNEETKPPKLDAAGLLNKDAGMLNKALTGGWMRVGCSIGRWDDKVRNELVTNEVHANHNLSGAKVGEYYTRLFADARAELDALNSRLSAVRTAFYDVTKKVARDFYIAPVADMPNIIKKLTAAKQAVDQAKEDFRKVYDQRVQQARAQLNGTTSGLSYPSADDVLSRMYVDLSFEPIPDMRTFEGMSLPAEVTATFAAQVANRQTDLVTGMVENLYSDLVETTTDMAKYFNNKVKGEKGSKLYDSKIEKIKRLARQLESAKGIVNTDFSELSEAVGQLAEVDFDAAKASITAARGARDLSQGIAKRLKGLANTSATVEVPTDPVQAQYQETLNASALVETPEALGHLSPHAANVMAVAEALQPEEEPQPKKEPDPVTDVFAGLDEMFF